MNARQTKPALAAVAGAVIVAVAGFGIVQGAGRRRAQVVPANGGTGTEVPLVVTPVGDQLRAAAAIQDQVPWEARPHRPNVGLVVDVDSDNDPLHHVIADALHQAEVAPPDARSKHYAWVFDPPKPDALLGHPPEKHKHLIYGWHARIISAEPIPGGWRATVNVTPKLEAAWTERPFVVDTFREVYTCLDGQVQLVETIEPEPDPTGWHPAIIEP